MKKQIVLITLPVAFLTFLTGIYLGSHASTSQPLKAHLDVQTRLENNGPLIWNKSVSQDGLGLYQNASEGYYTSGCLVLLFDDINLTQEASRRGVFSPYRLMWVDADKSSGQGVWLLTVEGAHSACAQAAFKTFGWFNS